MAESKDKEAHYNRNNNYSAPDKPEGIALK